MTQTEFRPMNAQTALASLKVNQQYVAMLSPLTLEALAALVEGACYAKQAGNGEAFLIAFDQNAAYEGQNFAWFKARYKKFVYVDRIVIGDGLQRQGLGVKFYEDLLAQARNGGAEHLCAEVNLDPPNPASHAFHKKMGFESVGENHVDGKHVQYYTKSL